MANSDIQLLNVVTVRDKLVKDFVLKMFAETCRISIIFHNYTDSTIQHIIYHKKVNKNAHILWD